MLRRRFLPLLTLGTSLARAQKTDRSHGRSTVIASGGIVSTSQVLASQAGAMILAQGGSAVDAAITANAVLGVIEPMMCGIGGDLFVMYRDAKTGQLTGLNASGPAPVPMTIAALQAKGLKKMSPTGIHSVTVPGCVRGWQPMHRRHGKLAWNKLFDPAIRFAASGFPMQEMVGRVWDSGLVRQDPEGVRVFYPNGKAPQVGEIYRNPDLAKAMRLIAAEGADAFYKGGIATAILMKSQKLGGLLSPPDFVDFEPEWVAPIAATARQMRTRIVTGVGVDSLFNRASGQAQGLTPRRGFDGFQINIIGGTSSQQRIDLNCDFDGRLLGQRCFF